MNIHIHQATTSAVRAIEELSAVTLWDGLGTSDLSGDSVSRAREHLAKAAAELNAYDAKRNFKPEIV